MLMREVSIKARKAGYQVVKMEYHRGFWGVIARRQGVDLLLGVGPDRAAALEETIELLTEEL